MTHSFHLLVTGTVNCPNGDRADASNLYDITTSGDDELAEAKLSVVRSFLCQVPNVRRKSVRVEVFTPYKH